MRKVLALSVSSLLIFILACNPNPKAIKEGHDKVIIQLPNQKYSGNIHEITLYVNTSEITQTTTEEYSDFRQPYYVTNEDYTTYVSKGDIIIWRGVSITDTLDTVNITRIQHHAGKKLLGKNVLKGNDGDPEMVVGMIGKDISDQVALDHEKYIIHFTVYNNGVKRNGNFKIDPKLLPDY